MRVPLVAVGIVGVLAVWLWTIWRTSEPQGEVPVPKAPVPVRPETSAKGPAVEGSQTAADSVQTSPTIGGPASDADGDAGGAVPVERDEQDEELERLQTGLDEEDFARVRAAAAVLKRSPSADVRAKVVESLRWFGQKGLAEIKEFLGDADADVAAEAFDAFADALREIADEPLRAQQLYEGVVALRDEDAIQDLIMQFYELDDAVALPHIVRLIASENPAAAAAGREAHEHVTGEPFVNPAATQRWLDENRVE